MRDPFQLRLVFFGVMVLLASALVWLGVRLLDQDRQLSAQRLTEQRETASELAIAGLETRISGIGQILGRTFQDVPTAMKDLQSGDGAVFVQFLPHSIRAWPENALVYYPELTAGFPAATELFDMGDEFEFRKNDYAAAIAVSRDVAASHAHDPEIQAAALVRIARNNRKNGHFRDSLEAYAQLSALGPTSVDGMPAGLAGDVGVIRVSEDRNDSAELATAAGVLIRDLNSARWPIDYETYTSLSQEARRFLPENARGPAPQPALAEAVESIWEQWTLEPAFPASGHISLNTPSGPVLFIWRGSERTMTGFAANAAYLESRWLGDMRSLDARQARIALSDPNGLPVLGNGSVAGDRAETRLSSETGLPWTVQAFNSGIADPALVSRHRLLAFGMAVLVTLILIGGWFIGHAVARELAVARLQSDFVSVVSHEFRTPLTTLCQLSELLQRGRVASDEDRQQYYDFLNHESHRLRRLVESLLDFGRLESGKMEFRFEDVDAAEFVHQASDDFVRNQQACGHRFEVETGRVTSMVRADRETLVCVFWNLFENAVKYSPNSDIVWVELANRGSQVEIAVRDKGVGIPHAEQHRVFEKFVRGDAARESGIRGTGIGLATARQIVRAHGGDITLESEPGKGSTFRVVLPLRNGKGITA